MTSKVNVKDSHLRKRRAANRLVPEKASEGADSKRDSNEEVVWGKTPSGAVFRVPTTHDVLTLFHPGYPKSHFDLLNLALLGLQLVLFAVLSNRASKIFFFLYFAFWRAAYDLGLGWVLTKQSKKKWIVRQIQARGWLNETSRPRVREWIRKQLVGKMGKDYKFEDLPIEYNSWLLFRQLVDIILLNDFLSYCMFAFSCFRVPTGISPLGHVMRWIGGIALIAFNLWVKTEAHHVVKDYGWYWGDTFFQRGALVFDGVFEMAPHPMYSVGYAGYYGLSLIVGSYPVLFASLAAHAAQFGFLVFFENPHIERMYGQRKLLAQRTPLFIPNAEKFANGHSRSLSSESNPEMLSTPSFTEGETATETDVETEVEDRLPAREKKLSPERVRRPPRRRLKPLSQHDLLHRYFRKDVIGFRNVDLLRASDLKYCLLILYGIGYALLPTSLKTETSIVLHTIHAIAWRLFHSVGLGILLHLQSDNKFLVRHFLKHYHYAENTNWAVVEAFDNWKAMYSLSLTMNFVSFVGLSARLYKIPDSWSVGDELLRHTFGVILIGLHIWAAMESLEVLGVFGWFFGDFFIEGYPTTLEYTGIYRYLNNPERTMSGAAYFGLALISGSKLVFALAVLSHLAHWGFLSLVEGPHMRKLYGSDLRKDAGLTKVIKKVTRNQAKILKQRVPEVSRVAQEVRGTFEKVYEETAQIVEDFLTKSKPRIEGVVQDSMVLLQQSRERLVITRVANDFQHLDTKMYSISLHAPGKPAGLKRYHVGEAIRVKWRAPRNHSRKDWIGIYRFGANPSNIITKISSLGIWVPVHDEEWDGHIPLDTKHHPVEVAATNLASTAEVEQGEVVFEKEFLPSNVGIYEARYHHDGKYNVLGLAGPFEIYVDRPERMDFDTVRAVLLRIIVYCLDSDPSLIPLSAKESDTVISRTDSVDGEDRDNFQFWSEKQAKRIALCIKHAFDVEYVPEVVLADANVSSLARKILVSRELLAADT